MVLIGSVGAIVVWFIRLRLPESPRWLIQHGRVAEADAITTKIEAAVQRDLGGAPLPPVVETMAGILVSEGAGKFAEIFSPAYRPRTVMLMVFQFFQTVGFYGFANWVPTLIAQQGINLSRSLLYSFVIAIANPFGPALAFLIADKVEVKWILVTSAFCIGLFGMLFAMQHDVAMLILFGVLITLANTILSFSFHTYQSELFPTRIRARAIGFTYAFSRLSTVFVSFMIGFFLQTGGVPAVFSFIAGSMLIVMLEIGLFGPRTRNLQLERISSH